VSSEQVQYLVGDLLYTCCRKIWLCNPFQCFDFSYGYVSGGNGTDYQFNLNLSDATNISWTVDETGQSLGSNSQSGIMPVPSPCVERTITVRYYWGGRWYICCRRVFLCNPFNCGSITFTYQQGQGYQFNLTQSGSYQNITWQVDQTGQSLGNGGTSQPLPAPGTCVLRTISVRYYDPVSGCWRICCLTLWLCDPVNCSGIITPQYGQNGSTTLQVNSSYQDVVSFNGSSPIGNGNSITVPFPPGSTPTVYVRYFDPASGCYYYCCKTLNVPAPCLLTPAFTFAVSGNTVNFSNQSTGTPAPVSCSWTFGSIGSSSQCNPVQTLPAGTHNCCLTVSNGCTSQTICQNVTVNCLPPSASFTYLLNNGVVNFTSTSTGNPASYNWTFGGAGTSNQQNPVQTFQPGSYNCCLTVSNACGASPPSCQTITVVCNQPVAAFTFSVSGGNVSFINNSSNATSYLWSFGNGNTSTDANPPAQAFSPGTYNCCLTATNSCGTVQSCQTVNISPTTPPGWNFVPTGANHTIIVPAGLVSNINGQPLTPGDLIGFFFVHNGSQHCAGFGQWNGSNAISFPVFGNDAAAPDKNGFATGETFNVKVWRAAAQTAFDVQASYSPPDGILITHTSTYANDGVSQLQSLDGSFVLNINLTEGWNMISSYVNPSNTNMADVFAGIQNQVILVKDGSGNVYIPSSGINTIGNWTLTKGYQVKVSVNTTLSVSGTKAEPATTPVPISTGWQIIAYLRDNPSSPASQFDNIASSISLVKNNIGQTWLPSLPTAGTLTSLLPTQGYKVKASAPATLFYSANFAPGAGMEDRLLPVYERDTTACRLWTKHFSPTASKHLSSCEPDPTGENATIVFPQDAQLTLDGNPLPIGSRITAMFDNNGVLTCAGVVVWTGEPVAMTVYGDDGENAGFTNGEEYKFRIELPDDCIVAEVDAIFATGGIFSNAGVYESDGISGIVSLQAHRMNIEAIGQDPLCAGEANGSAIVAFLSNGIEPYHYQWSHGDTNASVYNLPTGDYSVSIYDANGCYAVSAILLLEPPSLNLLTNSTPEENNGNNGAASVTVSGGTPPYYYQWDTNPPVFSAEATGLFAGNYSITVTDAHDCSISATIVVDIINASDEAAIDNTGFKVFPNPSTGKFSIAIPPSQVGGELKVYEITGRLAVRMPINETLTILDLSDLPMGVYMLEILGDSRISTTKLVLKKPE
jgi:PKD repeat protein